VQELVFFTLHVLVKAVLGAIIVLSGIVTSITNEAESKHVPLVDVAMRVGTRLGMEFSTGRFKTVLTPLAMTV